MSYYSNPTANAAIGSIDAEIRKLRKEAKRLGQLKRQGRLTPQMEAQARKRFVGIYRRFLEEALSPKGEGELP